MRIKVLTMLLIAACFTIQYQRASMTLMRRGGPEPTAILIYKGKLSLQWKPHAPYRPKWAGQTNNCGFRYNMYSDGSWNVWGPLWVAGTLLATAEAPLATLPWFRWHFKLRTLLIATTAVAVVLGAAVMMLRGS